MYHRGDTFSVKDRFDAGNLKKDKNLSASEKAKDNNLKLIDGFLKTVEAGKTYLVKRIIDGDTIELEGGERVRYIGIDTPETVNPGKLVQCFGKEASRANRELVEGKLVKLEKDISNRDKYGRLLRYVYQEDKFVNLELVRNGYAYAFTYPPDVKNSKLFVGAEKAARENHQGLWDTCLEKT